MTDVTAKEKWYQRQGRFIIMYDHQRGDGRFFVTDIQSTNLFAAEFSTRALAIDWCYDMGGKNDKSNS
jgi:hypothetical protein